MSDIRKAVEFLKILRDCLKLQKVAHQKFLNVLEHDLTEEDRMSAKASIEKLIEGNNIIVESLEKMINGAYKLDN